MQATKDIKRLLAHKRSHTRLHELNTLAHMSDEGTWQCNQNRRNLEAQKQLEELWVTSLEQDDSW